MIAKNCGGRVPEQGEVSEADTAMLTQAYGAVAAVRAAMRAYAPHTALSEIWAVVAETNRYFAGQEPWKLTKTDPARRDSVLFVTAETLRVVALLCQPFIPAGRGQAARPAGRQRGSADVRLRHAGTSAVSRR